MITRSEKRRYQKAGAFLLAGGLMLLLLLTTLVPGLSIVPLSSAAQAASNQLVAAQSCKVTYFALDATQTKANPNKVSPEDLGPRVNATTVPQALAELKERRTCGADGKFDTELLATQYADWSAEGLTSRKVAFSEVDAFRHQLNNDSSLYKSTLDEIQSLEGHSVTSLGSVPKGVWSVYALPDGKGDLTTHVGHTGSVGTALVFVYKGKTIKYRLECGFQIVRETQPPGLAPCDYANCGPKPVTPPTTHVPTCQETGTCGTTTPTCPAGYTGTPPNCLLIKLHKNDVKSPQGWTQQTIKNDPIQKTAPAPKKDPVKATTPVHSDPGPSVPVQGASPNPSSSQSAAPAPVITQAPAPSDPGSPITEPAD